MVLEIRWCARLRPSAGIACSVAALIATMVWMGWELGTLEAVCVAVLVGLSVDYSLSVTVLSVL